MQVILKDSYSATDLPSVGERVVYAPQGIFLSCEGIVLRHETRFSETRVVVRLDSGGEATMRAKNLYRAVAS